MDFSVFGVGLPEVFAILILLVVVVFLTSKRESLEEMKDSFSNILNIDNIK